MFFFSFVDIICTVIYGKLIMTVQKHKYMGGAFLISQTESKTTNNRFKMKTRNIFVNL